MQYQTLLLTLLTALATTSLAAPAAKPAPFPLPSPLEEPDQSCHALGTYGSERECKASCGKDQYTGTCTAVGGSEWNCYCNLGGPNGFGSRNGSNSA